MGYSLEICEKCNAIDFSVNIITKKYKSKFITCYEEKCLNKQNNTKEKLQNIINTYFPKNYISNRIFFIDNSLSLFLLKNLDNLLDNDLNLTI